MRTATNISASTRQEKFCRSSQTSELSENGRWEHLHRQAYDRIRKSKHMTDQVREAFHHDLTSDKRWTKGGHASSQEWHKTLCKGSARLCTHSSQTEKPTGGLLPATSEELKAANAKDTVLSLLKPLT
ncbi:hypothetical protein NW767_003233 [Fusarium falciforme]|nr:hypothetical protein NW767_003233 [Fusarium falciforme]